MKRKEFRLFFDSFYPSLVIFAQKYVQDADVADDMVQDAFIKFWDRKNNFTDDNGVKAFLYTVTRNNCLNYIKHQKIKLEFQNYSMDSELFFRDHIIEEETYKLIYDAITCLPSQGKRVVELSLKGMKNPEIALRLDISVNTVKSVKANAYRLLRMQLKGQVVAMIVFTMILGC